MDTSSILSSLGPLGGAASSATSSTSAASSVNKDDFLKLLTTQLRYQNPLDPMKDADFVAQLAQFSSLEGIQQMNSSIQDLVLLQGLTQGANLIGKKVTYDQTGTGAAVSGTVDSIGVHSGKVLLMVSGTPVAINQVKGIEAGR